MSWVVFSLGAPLLAAGAWLVWRRPLYALYAFLVGLAFHNAAFMGLWLAGAEGWQLTVLQAWKEILLGTALLSVLAARRLPPRLVALDLAALALALVAAVYLFLPADTTVEGRLYGLRSIVLPLAAYALGRCLVLGAREWRRVAAVGMGMAVAVAVVGLVENYGLTIGDWRAWGAKGYYSEQLDFPAFHGPAGLPDNWALNLSDGVFRRLISTYLSPLGTAYMLAVALILAVVELPRVRGRALLGLAAASLVVLAAFLLAFSRAAALALVGALVVLALARRSFWPVAGAAAVLLASVATAAWFTSVAPETRFFPEDRAYQERRAREEGPLPPGSPLETTSGFSDSSSREHLAELRRSFENFLDRPQGHGLGTSGQIAQRFGEGDFAAGESLYLTVAVETGAAGLLALLALAGAALLTLFRAARRRAGSAVGVAAGVLLAAQAAVFAIGLQTEVWGIPWLVYVLWLLTGSVVTGSDRYDSGRHPGQL
ncbi:MAG: O-antigen ligase family protein [Gaiellaceae bacterium]